MKLLALLTFAGLLVACGYRTALDPVHRGSAAGLGGSGADAGRAAGGNGGAGDAGNGACYGTCETPPGPVALYPRVDELAAALVGTWQICSGGHELFGGAPSDTIGVEFGPPSRTDYGPWEGEVYFLRRGPAGPVRGPGPGYEQHYQVDDDMTLGCRPAPDTAGSWFSLMYSRCPREWWLEDWGRRNGTLASF